MCSREGKISSWGNIWGLIIKYRQVGLIIDQSECDGCYSVFLPCVILVQIEYFSLWIFWRKWHECLQILYIHRSQKPNRHIISTFIYKHKESFQQTLACFLPTTVPHRLQKCTLSLQDSMQRQLIPKQAKGDSKTHHTQAAGPNSELILVIETALHLWHLILTG